MKKVSAILLFLIGQLFAGVAIAGQDTPNTANTLKIKLPDGLYLYQPQTNSTDNFSPLIIIEDGKLIDPYPLLAKQGNRQFEKKYIKGRRFNVFVGKEPVGKLNGFKLQTMNCETKAFLPFYRGRGVYKGVPLPAVETTVDKPLYLNSEKYAALKAVASPGDIGLLAVRDKFTITEEDKTIAVAAIKQDLVPMALRRIEKAIKKRSSIEARITNDGDMFYPLIADDIDGNGKKDLLGIYTLLGIDNSDPKIKNYIKGSSEMIFVVWDTGKAEVVMSSEHISPAFALGGFIDIDHDGVQEIIVQKSTLGDRGFDVEGYIDLGTEINIMRHTTSGWKNIYRSSHFCRDISY